MSLLAINAAKRAASHEAVNKHLLPTFRAVGIGSGSTVVFCVERIKELVDAQKLDVSQMVFVPTGFQSEKLLVDADLPVRQISSFEEKELDIVFDGADEVDTSLNCVKGGGACLLQEKLVGMCSKKFIVVADDSKTCDFLGQRRKQGVPVEVVPMAAKKVTANLKALGAVSIALRDGGKAKAGPIVTDNGNFILDAYFGEIQPENVSKLDTSIKLIVGVVETGLFDYAAEAYIGKSDGSFSVLTR